MKHMRLETLTTITVKIKVFWDMKPWKLVFYTESHGVGSLEIVSAVYFLKK